MTGVPDAGFGSDNCAGIHPDVLAALAAANVGAAASYGADEASGRLDAVIRSTFGDRARSYSVFTGTGANVIALGAMTTRWAAVICAASAHIAVDECGAPEKLMGLKLLTAPAPDGKLTPALVDSMITGVGDEHRAQPTVLSVTESTEYGTLYTAAELAALCDHAHSRDIRVHLDGSRLANAAAALGVTLRELTTDVGVDVLSLGGTKNGLMCGELVVVLNPAAVEGVDYLRKLATQLGSKTRYLAAQFLALLDGELWRRNAETANAMAARLGSGAAALPGVELVRPVQANAVFARLPAEAIAALQAEYSFEVWDEAAGEVRWMTSFATTAADVDRFVAALGVAAGSDRPHT
jgi:threonine aldolase